MEFANKVVLITGASSGIGATTAKLFAEQSAHVVLVGRNEANLKEVTASCEGAKGKKALPIVADMTIDADVKKIINETLKTFDRLDVLVNNAGIVKYGRVVDGIESYDAIMATNVRGIYLLTGLAAPHLIKTKGNIVNVSSIAGSKPLHESLTAYSMSKAALNMFNKCTALELAPHGVRVNAVLPGATKTGMVRDVNSQDYTNFNARSKKYPLQKGAKSIDIAEMIMYFAGERARSITGAETVVDNGQLLMLPSL